MSLEKSLWSTLGGQAAPGGTVFPSPWQDYASAYTPTTIRGALHLCEILYVRNAIYRQASERIVDYFTTKPIFKGQDDKEREKFEKLMTLDFGVLERLREVGHSRMCYGNAFLSIHLPFRRVLRCKQCNAERTMIGPRGNIMPFHFSTADFSFTARCDTCKRPTRHFIRDYSQKDARKIKLICWDPKRIIIEPNMITGDRRYWMEIDPQIIQKVQAGDPFILATLPLSFLQAIKNNQKYLFDNTRFYHSSEMTLPGVNLNGWGIPPILSAFRNFFRLQVLYRYDEVMKMDYIVPLRIISPAVMKAAAGNDFMNINLQNMAQQAMSAVERHRVDGADWNFFPFPIQYQAVGGEGQQLDQTTRDTITAEEDRLLNARGIPPELYRGSMSLVNAPVGLRLFEASHTGYVSDMNRILQWMSNTIGKFMNTGDHEAELESVKITDNLDDKAWRLQAAMTGAISKETGLGPLGIDSKEETKRVIQENIETQNQQQKAQQEQQMAQITLGAPDQAAQDQQGAAAQGGGMTPDDVEAQADEEARRLLDPQLPEQNRRQELSALRTSNPTLHAVVIKKMDQYRNQAGTAGQSAGLQQMGIGGGQKVATLQSISELMGELNREFPIPSGSKCNHAITMPAGSSKVKIAIYRNNKWDNVLLSQEDFSKTASSLVAEIREALDSK